MFSDLLVTLEVWQIVLVLFLVMLASTWLGLVAGKKLHRDSNQESTILGALFGLLALLLAFTFSMSANRYDNRRQIIVEEANDIGTAILRADLYPAGDRQQFRNDFKEYVEARIKYFEAGTDQQQVIAMQKQSGEIQQRLWNRSMQLSHDSANYIASMQMIPALNTMIDITTTRWYAGLAHVPDTVVWLLFFLSCAAAFYIGYVYAGKEKMDWLHVAGFCLLTCLVILVILDLDRPREGFITLKPTNQAIVDLRQMFTEEAGAGK